MKEIITFGINAIARSLGFKNGKSLGTHLDESNYPELLQKQAQVKSRQPDNKSAQDLLDSSVSRRKLFMENNTKYEDN